MNHQTVYVVFLCLCSGYALARGGGPERAAATLMLMSVAASAFSIPRTPTSAMLRFRHLEVSLFVNDLIAYAASVLLMLRSERFWTIWMSALFGVELSSHLLAMPGLPSLNLTYAILERVWGYPLALLPAIGTWRHRRRLTTYGEDRSWSGSSRASPRMTRPTSPTD